MNSFAVYTLPLYAPDGTVQHGLVSSITRGREVISPEKRDNIIRVINTVWDIGLHNILRPFAKVLTPLSSVYSLELNQVNIDHVKMTARYCFVWLKRGECFHQPFPCNSKYGVFFTITTRRPHGSFALAFMLLRFSEAGVQDGNYRRFKLVDLCYQSTECAAYGIMFFDEDCCNTYDAAKDRANSIDNLTHACIGPQSTPISTWNGDLGTNTSAHIRQYLDLVRRNLW
ncbi:hypothetical protein NMY22_g7589 [Coprinellus aureogranulatus]|nr:hypothetical protein NMY22_g7589 [Coprinellus aureogranulatus]